MDTQSEARLTSSDLTARITDHIQELAEATDAARTSREMLRYLDMFARIHQYSIHNVWLILMARPSATLVAGFKKWQTMDSIIVEFGKEMFSHRADEAAKLIGETA